MIWGGLKPTHHNKMVGLYRALSELAKWMVHCTYADVMFFDRWRKTKWYRKNKS